MTYTTKQGSRGSWLAQTGFAAFGKGVQLIGGSPYAETEQLSRLTTTSEIGSQPLLASPSSNVLLGRGAEKALNERQWVSNVFLSAA